MSRGNLGDLVDERRDPRWPEIQHGSYLLTVGGLTSNAQSDGFAALGVATAIPLGLLARDRGSGGQEITTTMLNTNAHAMLRSSSTTPGGRNPAGTPSCAGSARYRVYDAADGWVFLAVPATRVGPARRRDAPHADLAGDRRFADGPVTT